MTQAQQIDDYLTAGNKLTVLDGIMRFRCTQIPARIFELNERGAGIVSKMIKLSSGRRIAIYSKPHAFASGDLVRAEKFSLHGHYCAGDEGRVIEVNYRARTMSVRIRAPLARKGIMVWVNCAAWVRA